MGLSATHIGTPARRDRLLFLAAIAYALLVLLGAAGERCGLDRTLEANTVAAGPCRSTSRGASGSTPSPPCARYASTSRWPHYDECVREHAILREIFSPL
jgi:hypothetical protein